MLTHLNHNTMYLFTYHHNGLMSTYAFGAHEAPRTVYPKYLSCHRAIVVIGERARCIIIKFIAHILPIRDLTTLCHN